ncbi:MAG: tetratricopeptide repeat protein [Myxococcota bacterium]
MAVALGAFVLLLFARSVGHDFVSLDDPAYVLENPPVRQGLTLPGLGWAFSSLHSFNWHPLTWLSHMLDVSLFGLDPAGHHLMSAALHALTTVVLFQALRRMTRAPWPSLLVAALFAFHPLRVESVAWVAERKDVLSGLFFAVTLLAYGRYTQRPGRARYATVFVSAALGLLCKPTAVTLPIVLLLLDLWPLSRREPLRRLLLEKLPLLGLSAVSALITLVAQGSGGAVRGLGEIPFWVRIANALVSCVVYLEKTVWPRDLAVFYPHAALLGRAESLVLPALASGLLLLAITALAYWRRRREPYLLVGWLWYLVALVPMLGLVQVGGQALADRYTYLPSMGLALAAVWGARDLFHRLPLHPAWGVAGALLGVALLGSLSWRQLSVWRDSESLYSHAVRVTRDNYFAHTSLARVQRAAGKLPRARAELATALAAKPDYMKARIELGEVLERMGDLEQASLELDRVRRARPHNARVHGALGRVRLRQGRLDQAVARLERAVALDPAFAEAHDNLGLVYLEQGRLEDARERFERAAALRPDAAPPRVHLRELRQKLKSRAGGAGGG